MAANGVREIPPRLELECLKALWALGEGNVKDVRQAIAANRNLAYTTVMTVLDRLARKGGVARRRVGRSFVYAPVLRRDNLRRLAIQDLVDRFFDGSQDALIDFLRNGLAPEDKKNAASSPVARDDEHGGLDAAAIAPPAPSIPPPVA